MYYGKGVALLLVAMCQEWIVLLDDAMNKAEVENAGYRACGRMIKEISATMELSKNGLLHAMPLRNWPWPECEHNPQPLP